MKRNKTLALFIASILLFVMIPCDKIVAASEPDYGVHSPTTDMDGNVIYDCIYFGNYFQDKYTPQEEPAKPKDNSIYTDKDGTKFVCDIYEEYDTGELDRREITYYKVSPVRWRVLDVNGTDALLIADKAIEMKEYNTEDSVVSWKESTLRSWLNGYDASNNKEKIDFSAEEASFISKAFTKTEREAIIEAKYSFANDSNIKDKIRLMSAEEYCRPEYGFSRFGESSDHFRCREITDYAFFAGGSANHCMQLFGSHVYDAETDTYDESRIYLTIMLPDNRYIGYSGWISDEERTNYAFPCDAICPILHLDLSQTAVWTKDKQEICYNYRYVDADENEFNYTRNKDGSANLTSCYSESQAVTIPSIVNGRTVNTVKELYMSSNVIDIILSEGISNLGEYAFHNTGIRSMKIPSSIKTIPLRAFEDCQNLEWVELSEGLETIGSCAFSDCKKLSEMKIPNGVTKIASGAFYGCSNLKTITIPNSVTDIGWGICCYCSSLTEVQGMNKIEKIPEYAFGHCSALSKIAIPDTVWSIGEGAFLECSNLTVIDIPSGVTAIEKEAFLNCKKLSKVTIPSSVKSIGEKAFSGCSKELVIYGEKGSAAEEYAMEYSISFVQTNAEDTTAATEETTAEESSDDKPAKDVPKKKGTTLSDKKSKAKYEVTSSSKKNPTVAYKGTTNKKAKSITVPDTVTVDGIKYKVTSIKKNALKGNKKITKVTIGKNIIKIGENAFSGCSKLKTITIKSTNLKTVGKYAIKGIYKKATIKVPAKKRTAYKKLFTTKTGFRKGMKIK